MKQSIWSVTVKMPEFPKLNGDKKTDVLIIGGGLCGILCAYYLKQVGVDYILVEGNKIASGITKNTTAKITSQHGLIYSKLIKKVGIEKARMYLEANHMALEYYNELCKEIDCDYEIKPAYTYSLNDRCKIEEEVKAVTSLGFSAHFTEKTELPFETKGAICFENQAQFHPLKFVSGIIKDLNIYENTYVRKITKNIAFCDNGRVSAKKIVVATHFPFINKYGGYFLKLYQHRSYVTAYKDAPDFKGMYVDEDKTGMSFRNYNNYLLIGGGGHRTGKHGGNWYEIKKIADKYYPIAKSEYQWATQDCMSLDDVPYIGQYSRNIPNVYVATGFNKWGITSSMVAAQILADMLQEKRNPFAPVFSPQRSIVKPQLFINGIESSINLLKPVPRRCPHLGCALKWNKLEHSWDCPCHGSRFEQDGKLIDNPATCDADVQ